MRWKFSSSSSSKLQINVSHVNRSYNIVTILICSIGFENCAKIQTHSSFLLQAELENLYAEDNRLEDRIRFDLLQWDGVLVVELCIIQANFWSLFSGKHMSGLGPCNVMKILRSIYCFLLMLLFLSKHHLILWFYLILSGWTF